MHGLAATKAYARSASHRGFRQQEADVFHRVNAVLRGAQQGDSLALSRALADNERLWTTVMDAMRSPENQLPPPLRASIVAVGMSVQREATKEAPDIGFIIGVNEQLAAGLSGI